MCQRTIAGVLYVGILLALVPAIALAAQDACVPAPPVAPSGLPAKPPSDSLLHVRADRATVVRRHIAVFSGHVLVQYQGQSITADLVRYNRATGVLKARGHVVLYGQHGAQVRTGQLDLNPQTHVGKSGRVVFKVVGGMGRGDARAVDFKNRQQMTLKDARYTTCPVGHGAWYLEAGKLDLDQANSIGTARDAHVDFKGVPLFFWPYLSFPLSSQRKSGFLGPRYGALGNAGLAIALPYYWNIAPEIDDTLTPRFYSRRGLQWQNETRYLGQNYGGSFVWQYLRNDRVYHGNRYSLSLLDNQVLSSRWTVSINYQKVSDFNYLSDFAENLAVASQTDLPQNVEFQYTGPLWHVVGLASRFQNLDPTIPSSQLPYTRMPEIRFSADPAQLPDQLNYSFRGQVDNFQGSSIVNGRRLDLYPNISFPIRGPDGFVVPEVGVRQTDYVLSGAGPQDLTRTLPIVSLDNGLYFDRSVDGGKYQQTLEPRFYYLYIPYVNQANFPNFDTITPDFNFSNLFLHNRFFGADRVGDANQATLATTTRLLSAQGEERARVSLGRIFYFSPQLVSLTPGVVEQSGSDWVAEASARLVRSWYVRTGIQWDVASHTTRLSDFSFQYQPDPGKIINFGREYIAGVQNQLNISVQWPLYRGWTAIVENQYSLLNKTNLESYLGIQYNTCCWAGRVYFHRQLNQTLAQVDSVMFQFELKGLASLGTPPINPLAEGAFVFGNP